ncbi:MAG: hypothetical protein HKM07_08180 [Chlamydiae bacterium]|nr:hypothetical protein [Chlamydiota bacterium]
MNAKQREELTLRATAFRNMASRYDKRALIINIFAIIIAFTGHSGWGIFFGCFSIPFLLMGFILHVSADKTDPENYINYWMNDGKD